MPDRIGRLTPLEESVMNVLWTADNPLTISAVHAKLVYPVEVLRATVGNTLRRLAGAGYAQHTTTEGTAAYAYSPTMPCAEYLGQVVAAALGRSPDKHLTLRLGMSGAGLGYLADLLTDLQR
jgi:predicted transcriptional regulator